MTFAEFTSRVKQEPRGVVLLEGRQAIPASYAAQAQSLAARLSSFRIPRFMGNLARAEGHRNKPEIHAGLRRTRTSPFTTATATRSSRC